MAPRRPGAWKLNAGPPFCAPPLAKLNASLLKSKTGWSPMANVQRASWHGKRERKNAGIKLRRHKKNRNFSKQNCGCVCLNNMLFVPNLRWPWRRLLVCRRKNTLLFRAQSFFCLWFWAVAAWEQSSAGRRRRCLLACPFLRTRFWASERGSPLFPILITVEYKEQGNYFLAFS